jgi:alpha-L-fucosidase 2
MIWANKKIEQITIKSIGGTAAKIRYNGKVLDLKMSNNQTKTFTLTDFQ